MADSVKPKPKLRLVGINKLTGQINHERLPEKEEVEEVKRVRRERNG
jgi:hypothetical protein